MLVKKKHLATTLMETNTPYSFMMGAFLYARVRVAEVTIAKIQLHDTEELLQLIDAADANVLLCNMTAMRTAVHQIMLKAMRASIYNYSGQFALAIEYANATTRLAKNIGLSSQYTVFCALCGIELVAEVHKQHNIVNYLKDDVDVLQSITSKYSCGMDTYQKYAASLKEMIQGTGMDPIVLDNISDSVVPISPNQITQPALKTDLDLIEKFLITETQEQTEQRFPKDGEQNPLNFSMDFTTNDTATNSNNFFDQLLAGSTEGFGSYNVD